METIVKENVENQHQTQTDVKSLKERKSNIEFLRIIAMILIILSHYAYHGNLISVENSNINKYIALLLLFGGKLGVDIFILITGYFQINSTTIKIKKVLLLIAQVYFYCLFFEILNGIINNHISKELILNSIMEIFKEYWFIRYYIVIYMISPVINWCIKKLERKNFEMLLFFSFIFFCIVPIITKKFSVKGAELFSFLVFIYCIGAYIKLYKISFKTIWDKVLILICSVFSAYIINLNRALRHPGENCRMYIDFPENFIPIILVAVILFIYFKDLKIKNNKIINAIAKLTFGVYLFHENNLFRSFLWNKILLVQKFYTANVIVLIIHMIFSILFIYAATYIIEFIRKPIENQLLKLIDFIKRKIDESFRKNKKIRVYNSDYNNFDNRNIS